MDDEDYEELSKMKWHVLKKKDGRLYAACTLHIGKKRMSIFMHRVIMKPPKGMVVDHIDGNGLNNTKENLRIATYSQNSANSKKPKTKNGLRGTSWNKNKKKWESEIVSNGKRIRLGCYETAEAAHQVYIEASKKLNGEFSPYV